MKTQYKTLILLLFVSVFACSDDYFDVNRPSATAEASQIGMSDLLGPIIHSTMEGQRSAELTFGNYTQYFVSQGGGAAGRTSASGLWTQIFLDVIPNALVIKERAAENNAIHYNAVANVLIAINLGIAADTWDNIPYSEANQSPENIFPKFDEQEAIYQEIFRLLDEAIAQLNQPDTSNFEIGVEDLIYGGDTDKWLRAAHSVKARYQLHLVNKGIVAPTDVLATIANGFTSSEDDFLMFYSDRNINPWYASEIVARSTGNFHRDLCDQLVNMMNGEYFPFQSNALEIDPRLPEFGEKGAAANWIGYRSGGESNGNTGFADGGFYTSVESPLPLITYAEAQFIKAEAAFLASGGTTTSTGSTSEAYNAYLEGIRASFNMFGVDGSEYIADGAIDVGQSNLRLEHIMKEKYIHNFLNPETFVDFRRYDFSDDVFRGLRIREGEEEEDPLFAGEWFLRADYPPSEEARNPSAIGANRESPITPVWWDN